MNEDWIRVVALVFVASGNGGTARAERRLLAAVICVVGNAENITPIIYLFWIRERTMA